MKPPPTYMVPALMLGFGIAMTAYEIYYLTEGRIEVTGLFLIPAFLTLGAIGLFDPRIPNSLQPGARGYPPWTRRVANACWLASAGIGLVLYVVFVR